jgi:hypothetical protein
MQKVVGSSPIIRSSKPRYGGVFSFACYACSSASRCCSDGAFTSMRPDHSK